MSPIVAFGPDSGFTPGYPAAALSHTVARRFKYVPTCAMVSPLYRMDAFSCVTICEIVALLPAKFVFVLLIWLSLTGVIWPLLALPGLTNAHPKVLMLGALVIGMLGLIGFFAYQFVELWRLGRFTWRT